MVKNSVLPTYLLRGHFLFSKLTLIIWPENHWVTSDRKVTLHRIKLCSLVICTTPRQNSLLYWCYIDVMKLTRLWPHGLRCLPAPCAGWCCCVPPLTGSCGRPGECYTLWLVMGQSPAARRGLQSPPGMPSAWGLSEACGLSDCSHEDRGREDREKANIVTS